MLIVFEPTFDGLLSAAAWCFRSGCKPEAMIPDGRALQLGQKRFIPIEPRIRTLFGSHLAKLAGVAAADEILDLAYNAFLSDREGISTWIFQYLELSIRLERDPAARLFEPCVKAVADAARRTAGQAHQYLGLIRFKPAGQHFLVADFEPDCNVLPLIMPHFCDRLTDQAFAIRDLRRLLAAVHLPDGRTAYFKLADQPDVAGHAIMPSGECEQDVHAAAWQRYLMHLTIPERINPKLMQSNMPKKYWRHLCEDPGWHLKGETAKQFPLDKPQ